MSEFESNEQLLHQSLAHHQAGRLDLAEQGYRAVLRAFPEQPDALHLLGILLFQQGKYAPSIDLLRQAISLRPAVHEQWINLAKALAADGRIDELNATYPRAAEQARSHSSLHYNFGLLFMQTSQIDQAIAALRSAIASKPDFFEAWATLGEWFLALGKADEAIDAVQNASRIQPQHPGPYLGLTVALLMRKQNDLAYQTAQKAISLQGNNPTALRMMAVVESARGRQVEAAQWAQRGISLDPEMPELHCILGSTLLLLGQTEQAIASLTRAIQLRPNYLEALHDLGFAQSRSGKIDAAISTYRQAIAANPNWALAHHALAHALLLKGDYANGFSEYEWRTRSPQLGLVCQDFPQPKWDGSDLNGKTVLIHAEQGFGDSTQFARYVPMIASKGGKVVLQCQDELLELFRTLDGVTELIPRSQTPAQFDVHCPMLSLAHAFKTHSPDSIPAKVPYLKADPLRSDHWKSQLAHLGNRRKIGLAWSGRATHPNDSDRSIPPATLADGLAGIDACFITLSKGAAAAEIAQLRSRLDLIDAASNLQSFADTAALLEQLDLVITVDTAVAHLAGAMGKQAWVLLPPIPDWRWMLNRADTPWYPTLRLFRAGKPRDWQAPLQQIAESLGQMK